MVANYFPGQEINYYKALYLHCTSISKSFAYHGILQLACVVIYTSIITNHTRISKGLKLCLRNNSYT